MMQAKVVKNSDGKFLNGLKDKVTVKITGEDTNGLYALMEQNNEPGVKVLPHTHGNEDEVFKLIQGTVKFRLGTGEEHILHEGDSVFCPRGIEHSWEVLGDKNAKVLLNVFPAGIEQMFIKLDAMTKGEFDVDKAIALISSYNIKMSI